MLREYRRASAASMDASLKPLMSDYLGRLEGALRSAGFAGRLLIVTSNGGVLDAAAVAVAPSWLSIPAPQWHPWPVYTMRACMRTRRRQSWPTQAARATTSVSYAAGTYHARARLGSASAITVT